MNSELFNRYAENPTIELRNQIVEDNLYMVDILIRKYPVSYTHLGIQKTYIHHFLGLL